MLALTLWQPWAHVVVYGGKRLENRSWAPSPTTIPLGTRFAVHASLRYDMPSETMIRRDHRDVMPDMSIDQVTRGAVIGVATFVDVLRSLDEVKRRVPQHARWWLGPLAFLLDDVQPIDPIPVAGARGFWHLPPDVERKVLIALPRTRKRSR